MFARSHRWQVALWITFGWSATATAVEVHPPLENALTRGLEARVTEDFVDVPLEQAVRRLCATAKVPVRLERQALTDEGLDRKLPVTLLCRGLTVGEALDAVLEPLALTYIVGSDWVVVTTQAKAYERMETRVYDVSKLVELLRPHLRPERRPSLRDGCFGPEIATGGFPTLSVFRDMLSGQNQNYQDSYSVRIELESSIPPSPLAAEYSCYRILLKSIDADWGMFDSAGGEMTFGTKKLVIFQPQHDQWKCFRLLQTLETMLTAPERPARLFTHFNNEHQRFQSAAAKVLDVVSQRPEGTMSLAAWVREELIANDVRVVIDHSGLTDEGVDWAKLEIELIPNVSRRTLFEAALEDYALTATIDAFCIRILTEAQESERNVAAVYDVSQIPESRRPDWFSKFSSVISHLPWETRNGVSPDDQPPVDARLLVLNCSHRAHEQAAKLFETLQRPAEPIGPVQDRRTTCLYPLPDSQSLIDLQRLLPTLVDVPGATWPEGSIQTLGSALVVRNTDAVHRQTERIVAAIHAAHQLNRATHEKPVVPPTSPPAVPMPGSP